MKSSDENTVKDDSSAIDIKVTPPTRQNTMKNILQPEAEAALVLSNVSENIDRIDKKEVSESQDTEKENLNSEDLSGSCEILDEEAYGDVTPEKAIDISCNDDIPIFTIVKDSNNDNSKRSELVETEAKSENKSNKTESMGDCDDGDINVKTEENTAIETKDETETIKIDCPSDDKSLQANAEKENSGNEKLNASPSNINNDNANSAFEISTFYV